MRRIPTVIVLGGGYGGARVAKDLANTKRAKVILIDKNPYHPIPAQYYELASFFRVEPRNEKREAEKQDFHRFFASAAVSLKEIFNQNGRVEVIQKEVSRVTPGNHFVHFADHSKLHYDWLVIALGSKTNYFNIPHLENNSVGLKSPGEAINIRNRIDELFYNSPKHKKITVVIGGGGFTGSELAGELVGYMKKLAKIHSRPVANWECIIVEASSSLLGGASPWVQYNARKRLSKLGVTLMLESPIVDVWPGLLYIGNEKRKIYFDLLVWTAGVKGACPGDILDGVELSKKGCLVVDSALRVVPHQNIFVVGDMAATMDLKKNIPIPMTAQKAIEEGKYVARVLSRLLKNPHASIRPFKPKLPGFIIPLGGKFALMEYGWIKLSGIIPWIIKYFVTLDYLSSLLPLRRAFQIIRREAKLYTQND